MTRPEFGFQTETRLGVNAKATESGKAILLAIECDAYAFSKRDIQRLIECLQAAVASMEVT